MLNLTFNPVKDGTLLFEHLQESGISQPVLSLNIPVQVDFWNKSEGTVSQVTLGGAYDNVAKVDKGYVCSGRVTHPQGVVCKVSDVWERTDANQWKVSRTLVVEKGLPDWGIRSSLDFSTEFDDKPLYKDFQYFIPPSMYDKNDLDDDGVDDYLQTQKIMFREDRLSTLSAMAYHPGKKVSLTISRDDIPTFDDNPDRPNKERVFFQKTDIGSLGMWPKDGDEGQILLRAKYPFFEGERSHALVLKERFSWESYWPALTGETLEVSYSIRIDEAPTFLDGVWKMYTTRMHELQPELVPLSASASELAKYRTDVLDRYFMYRTADEDPLEPAGYVMNCHPTEGVQLSDIIQFAFTGENSLSSYVCMRQGYHEGNKALIDHAVLALNFFADKTQIPESGLYYSLYSFSKSSYDFWWTGLLLPLAYAEGEELRALMGPVYDYRKEVIEKLKEVKGVYLRFMNEEVYGMLLCYQLQKKMGNEYANWLESAKRYAEFLLDKQADDGTWYRAYDVSGNPMIEPELQFGKTYYEQKCSSATSILVLGELYRITGDERYLAAAEKAAKYIAEAYIESVKFCGGVFDGLAYNKSILVDDEGIFFPMLAMYEMYLLTKKEYYLSEALRAAYLHASFTYLWDVPLPPESTLAKHGFRTVGQCACDIGTPGYTHPFEIRGVATMVHLAELSGDKDLLEVAELTWNGSNQSVSVPGKDWGYKYYGLQEEGYLLSWCHLDDPIFEDTAFGHRWKGEGNKTCFSWISEGAQVTYWQLMDRYNTADFDAIKKHFPNS